MRSGEVVVRWWWYPPIRHPVPLPPYHHLPRRLDQKVEWVKKSVIKKIERRLELERRKRTFLEGGLRARGRGRWWYGGSGTRCRNGGYHRTPVNATVGSHWPRPGLATRGPVPTDPVPSPMSSSTSVIYAFFHSLHSPVRGAPCHPSRDMPLLSSLSLCATVVAQRERTSLMDFGADRPTAPLDGRPLPPYSPPLDTECDRMRMGRFATESHTLTAASSNGPFCASTCGFVMVGLPRHPSWHLGAS